MCQSAVTYLLESIMYAYKKNLELQLRRTYRRCNDLQQYNTRHGADFALPEHHTVRYKGETSYKGAKLFNCLPTEVKTLGNLKIEAKEVTMTFLLFY